MAYTLAALRGEYEALFASAAIRPERSAAVRAVARKVLAGRKRYELVAAATGVPWAVIGVLHARESDCDFNTHLHNGDPLTARTHHVPAGRPPFGAPPFEWEDSAADALRLDHLAAEPGQTKSWDIADVCFAAETFNGFGYRTYHGERSPYLWGGTNHQQAGKYHSDGYFDRSEWDIQPGVAAVLLAILETVPDALGQPAVAPSMPPAAAVPSRMPSLAWIVATSRTCLSLIGAAVMMVWEWLTQVFGALPDIKADADGMLDPLKSMMTALHVNAPQILFAATLVALGVAFVRHVDLKRLWLHGQAAAPSDRPKT